MSVISLSLTFHLAEVKAGEQNFIRVDDMLLDLDSIQVRSDGSSQLGSQAAASFSIYSSKPWKNAILPVAFDAAVPAKLRQQFFNWSQDWTKQTGLRIVPRRREREYLLVSYKSDGCYAHVGARRGQVRSLNLAAACWAKGIVLHEIGHALGLMHEHQRPDRDNYISVDLSNVDPQNRFAFDRFARMDEAEAYDFLSIMHYDAWAFSNNGKRTIQVDAKYSEYQDLIGIHSVSDSDLRVIQCIYSDEVERRNKLTAKSGKGDNL